MASQHTVKHHCENANTAADHTEHSYETVHLRLQTRGLGFQRAERLADLSDFAHRTRGEYFRDSGAPHHQRSRKDVRGVVAAGPSAVAGVDVRPHDLAHRHRLAGQQRFIDLQVLAFDEHSVCWNTIAFGKHNHVAARHLPAWNPLALPVANDQRAGTRQVPERLQNALCARFLNHGDHDGEVGENEEDHSFPPVAERQVDDPAGDEQRDHGLAQHLEHNS